MRHKGFDRELVQFGEVACSETVMQTRQTWNSDGTIVWFLAKNERTDGLVHSVDTTWSSDEASGGATYWQRCFLKFALVIRGIPAIRSLAVPVKISLMHVQQTRGRKWDRDERISSETFLRHCTVLVLMAVDPIPISVEKRVQGMTTDADEAFDTSAARRIDPNESKEGEKYKPGSMKSTENVKKTMTLQHESLMRTT